VVAAFLLEYLFYLAAGFETIRDWLADRFGPAPRGLLLATSGLIPYLIYSIPTHQFHWMSLARVAALALTISLWYVILPRTPLFDGLFLVLIAAVMLRKFFDPIYTSPLAALRSLAVLGHLMLIHLAILAMLVERRAKVEFGFIPSRREWEAGIRNFLWFLPAAVPIALLLHVVRPGAFTFVWWKEAGTFLGSLWVVSLSEEFFFRGLLQNWLRDWLHNSTAALVLTSALFGLVHLPFRGFPNWRIVLLTAILGWFCGRAFYQTGSIRASMVTHALVVATGTLFPA
jgi:membrane protease YdiL (CAAX protease family)